MTAAIAAGEKLAGILQRLESSAEEAEALQKAGLEFGGDGAAAFKGEISSGQLGKGVSVCRQDWWDKEWAAMYNGKEQASTTAIA
jgi:hypothetical protein